MWSARWHGLFGLVMLFGAGVSAADAQYSSSEVDNRSPAVQTLESCLERTYPVGAYLSSDGGRSAKRLLSKCRGEGDAVSKECQTGTGDTSQNCSLKTASLVQEFLLLKERELEREPK
jgi:hypothetical protein